MSAPRVGPYRRPVPIAGQPGEHIDPMLQRDVAWIRDTFRVKITDGYATTGHAANGEHPRGLAVDVVPDTARGGTWDDVDRLMKWAEPEPGKPRSPFRWVGYNGDPNHGRGHHGHLSWNHDGSGRVSTLFAPDGTVSRGVTLPRGANSGGAGVPGIAERAAAAIPGAGAVLGPAAGALENLNLGDEAGDMATNVARKLVGMIVDAIGADGARILLYAGLVLGGTALAVMGATRAAGVKAPTNVAGLAALVATRNPKAAAAVGAATGGKKQ